MLLDAIKRDLLGGPATDLQAGWTRGDALRRRSAIVRTNRGQEVRTRRKKFSIDFSILIQMVIL